MCTNEKMQAIEKKKNVSGSGSGSLVRVVTYFNIRGPQFESSHRQNFILNIQLVYC